MNLHLTTDWLLKNRKGWIALFGLLLLALPLFRGGQLWAANIREINQTVPPPTATRLPTPVPPATPTPKSPEPPTAVPTSVPNNNQSSPATPTQAATAVLTATDRITGTVKTKNLNVRSGPGTGYSVIGVLPQNSEIELLEQNEVGDWWFVCCVPGSDVHGWVKAAFVTPSKSLADVKKSLPVTKEVALPSPTASSAVTTTTTVSDTVAASTTNNALQVTITQSPPFPLQGDFVTLYITITNPTATDANTLELRDELPTGMKLVDVVAANNGNVTQDLTENLREVYSASWPILRAGATVTVTVTLQIDANLADGSVLDNLAFAGGSDVPGSTAGLSIGMPPTDLPDFQ